MMQLGPHADAAGHRGQGLPALGASHFPSLTPTALGLRFPLWSWRDLGGKREGSGRVPPRGVALLGGLLGMRFWKGAFYSLEK